MIISKQMGKNLSRLTDEYKEVRTHRGVPELVMVNKQWIVDLETTDYWEYGLYHPAIAPRKDFLNTVKSDYNLGTTSEGYAQYYGI